MHLGGADPAIGGPVGDDERGLVMRTRHLLAGALALALAACSVAATPEPSPTPTSQRAAPTATLPASTPTAAPTASALDVKVTFDGETCEYIGPTVIIDGTVLRFEYVPDQAVAGSYLMVYGVEPGTTYQMLLDSLEAGGGHPNVQENIPGWVLQQTATWTHGAGSLLYTIESTKTGTDGIDHAVGGYQVMCDTPATYAATQLSVAGG